MAVAGILVVLLLSYALLHTSFVQTRLVKYFTGRIERTTGVKIEIGGVDFRPIKSLVLNDILLKDYRNDTLLYCKNLKVRIDSFRFSSRDFTVSEIALDHSYFNLWIVRGKDKSQMNLDVFLNSLQRGKREKAVGEELSLGWKIALNRIRVRNSRFVYKEQQYEPIDYGINWTDVECREVNADITEPDFSDGKFRMRVEGLSLTEKSGFVLRELNARVEACDSNLLITAGEIRTERSRMNLQKLEYNWRPGQGDWRNFITRMQQNYELGESSVSFIDLAYFNGRLRGIDNTVRCSGNVFNTVNRIEGRDLVIELGENSVLRGSFKSYGLPDFWNTIFEIDFQDTHLNPRDLETVYLPWLGYYIDIPAPLHHFKRFDLQGKFRGTVEDFMLTAESFTPGFRGNVQLAYRPCSMGGEEDCTRLSGRYRFPSVNFGRLGDVPFIGYGAMSGEYGGTLDSSGIALNARARIHSLNIHKGKLRDVDLFLTYDDNKLNLISSVQNNGAEMGIVLNYDSSDSVHFLSSKGHLAVGDLNRFGWTLNGEKEAVRVAFDLASIYKSPEESFAHLNLSDLSYTTSSDSFRIHQVSMENRVDNGYYTSSILSDVADMQIEGHYVSVRPLEFTRKLLMEYLPAYAPEQRRSKKRKEEVDFRYTIETKDINRVLQVLYPEIYVADGTRIHAEFSDHRNEVYLSVVSDSVGYGDWRLKHSDIKLKGDGEQLSMIWKTGELDYRHWSRIYNVRSELLLQEDIVRTKLQWCNWEDQTYSGDLAVDVKLDPLPGAKYRAEVRIHPGIVVMSDSIWKVAGSTIVAEGKIFVIDNFLLKGGEQYLSVNGRISENPADSLNIRLNRFNLTEFNRIFLGSRLNIFGMINGEVVMQDYYKDNLMYSDIQVENWGFNRDTLGSLKLKSYWDADSNRMVIQAENRVREQIPLKVDGFYAPSSDSIDVRIGLSEVGLKRIGKYADEYVERSEGNLYGDLRVTGTSARPELAGCLYFDSARIVARDLNTSFFWNDSIFIDRNVMRLNGFTVRDAEGNRSECSGFYSLSGHTYDLNVTSQGFLLMNTGYEHNETLYGRIYMSGFTNLNNREGVMNVTMNARPENKSELFLPLASAFTEEDGNFLHFVSRNQPVRRRNRIHTEKSGVVLNANLELNDNLLVQIVFDPTIGDVLKTTGSGDLKIGLDQDGAVNMFGEYKITKGSYLFTLGGVFNKNFQLSQGGSIKWNGSPYNAVIDVNAVYNLKTSLNELLTSTNSLTDRSTKVPVECILNLSDNITNPLVKFDINFPSLDSQTRSFIQSLFSSQDEINKQMFSLLMLNKFYKPDYMNTTDVEERNMGYQAGVTTASEMVSRQLSRWLSKISNNFDIDFSYRPGDNITSDEIELALSTQLLNDRVTLSANGNMDVGNTKNVTANSTNSSNIAGDFDVDVKLNKQGTLKLKAYSHTDEKIIYKNNTETIQGVGISYQETFDTFRELLQKYFGFLRRKK